MHSWIIQYGNYGDFRIDRDYQFAIEYWSTSLVPLEPHAKHERSIRHVEDNHYRVVAQVKHAQPSWTVIDFGLGAYGGPNIDPSYEVGSWVRGEISISIDSFDYFESLSKQTDAPALIYRWHLEEIRIQTAPFVEYRPRHYKRDENKWGWSNIGRTDGWEDDNGRAEYLLALSRSLLKSAKQASLVEQAMRPA